MLRHCWDMDGAHLSLPQSTLDALIARRVDVIVIPIGAPFEMISGYRPNRPVFGATFIHTFRMNYRPDKVGRYYVAWVPKSPPS